MQAVHVQLVQNQRQLVLAEAPAPRRGAGEILVSVEVISLNHGEVHTALNSDEAGARPGWEYAGVVLDAGSGSRFSAGDRVAGLMLGGAWAEQVSAPEQMASLVPEGVDLEAAVTMPVAGLTALLTLAKKPVGDGQRVLVTAATGAVGRLAIQLAAEAGAHVTAYIRRPEQAELVHALGAQAVLLPADDFDAVPPFDLVLEGVGGPLLAQAMTHLASEGACVLFGNAAHDAVTSFDPDAFRLRPGTLYGGTTLHGFFLANELTRIAAPPLLDSLMEKLREKRLDPSIATVEGWQEIDRVARALLDNQIDGRAVLRLG